MDETVQIYENVLRCPHCGGNNTHHFSVTYERDEDDPEKDIAIKFRCEGCSRISELTFTQHEGETLVKWLEPV
jgi:DNA-directed RNA polymerase subunit RPC12/RpoP